MGCGLSLCRTSLDGVGFTLRLLAHSSKLSPMASLHASRSAATTIAAGFSMTKQKAKPAAGGAAKVAATANASAAPVRGTIIDPVSRILGADQCQEFVAGLLVFAESAEHGTGNRRAVLLFDTAHLHAQVAGFDDHTHTLRRDFFLDRFGDLTRHALLNLQAPSEHIHQACDFAEADDFVAWQIRNVRFAEKRQQVMLAQAEKFDVLYYHHFVVGDAEGCAVQHMVEILMIAAG